MDMQELRVGNYLIFFHPEIGRDKITKLTLGLMYGMFNDPKNYGIEFYEPIPLTEDWLLKLGFEKDDNYFSRKHLHYNIDNSFFFSGNDHVSGGNNDAVINYVHQLQNLVYFLTGEELF